MKFLVQLFVLFLPLLAHAAPGDRLEFAYRNANSRDERHIVILQGLRSRIFQFSDHCGQSGERCECLFYRESSDPAPLRSAAVSMSALNNSLACTIPGDAQMPDRITMVAARIRMAEMITERTTIKTRLNIDEVLGVKHVKKLVRSIYRYSCDRTFFEGEGALASGKVECVPSQRLGILEAKYNYYLFKSTDESNTPSGDIPFASDTCGRKNILQIKCAGTNTSLRYGVYRDVTPLFSVPLSLRRGPNEGLPSLYGYAAKLERNRLCPAGLVRARNWVAQPPSIVQGTLDQIAPSPPSTFHNISNSLNDFQVDISAPAGFVITRQKNQVPCDAATGNCVNAKFASRAAALTVPYADYTSVVCVIPPELLGGI